MIDSFEVTVEETSDEARRFYWASLWREQGAVLICSVLIVVFGLWQIARDAETAFWAFCLGVAATFWWGWLQGSRHARTNVGAGGGRSIRLTVDSTGWAVCGENASRSLAWTEVARLYCLARGFLVVPRNGGSPLRIPTPSLTTEQKATFVELARAAGAQVR